MAAEGEGPGDYLVDGKCKYCGRDKGHAHDCPIFEYDVFSISEKRRMEDLHALSGETEESLQKKKDLHLTIDEQIAAIEQDIKAGPPETRKSTGRSSIKPPHLDSKFLTKDSQLLEELHQRILECHTLASDVFTEENQNFLEAHRELSETSKEYEKISARYQLFLSAYSAQRETDPAFYAHYSDQTGELKEDLIYLKSLLANYRREYQ